MWYIVFYIIVYRVFTSEEEKNTTTIQYTMTTLVVCRVCLSRNLRMHVIANTQLQSFYEKLSGIKLVTRDGKPDSICYICFSQLQKCWKFKEMSCKAEKILTEIFHEGVTFGQDNILLLDGEAPSTLSMSATKFVSMPEYVKNENPEVFIKEEVIGLIERISVEVQTEDAVTAIPVEYEQIQTNLLKQELVYSPEIDGDSQDTSYTPAANQAKKTIKSSKENNKKQITKTRKKCFTAKILNMNDTEEEPHEYDEFSEINKYNPKQHIINSKDEPFSCIRCTETFSKKTDLKIHIVGHTGENIHKCDVCNQTFFSKYSLKIHITQKHVTVHKEKKMHDCDRCNKTFNHKGTLRLHMRIHTGDKPYVCDKCSKTFSQKGTLQRHIRMHTGEKPYVCDMCTKTFNQESSLKRHIKMHTGDKPYSCTRCGKTYYESSHLTRHIRTHTGEKPFACDRCFQTFSQSSNLQAHMKKHTGVKATNYVCYECNKTFDHKSIFKRHLLKHTQEKPYPCDRCDKKYADKRTLQRHIVTHNLSD